MVRLPNCPQNKFAGQYRQTDQAASSQIETSLTLAFQFVKTLKSIIHKGLISNKIVANTPVKSKNRGCCRGF
jgi:hypothetical protein